MSFIIPFILLILPPLRRDGRNCRKLPEMAGGRHCFLLLYSKSGRVSTNYGFSDQKIHSEKYPAEFSEWKILTK